jgi:hypothetical protein
MTEMVGEGMTGTEGTTGKIVGMHLDETSENGNEREQANGRLVLQLNVLPAATFLRLVAVRSPLGFSLA